MVKNEFEASESLLEAFHKASHGKSLIHRWGWMLTGNSQERKVAQKELQEIVFDITQSIGNFLEMERPNSKDFPIGEMESKMFLQAAQQRFSHLQNGNALPQLLLENIAEQANDWAFQVDRWGWKITGKQLVLHKC